MQNHQHHLSALKGLVFLGIACLSCDSAKTPIAETPTQISAQPDAYPYPENAQSAVPEQGPLSASVPTPLSTTTPTTRRIGVVQAGAQDIALIWENSRIGAHALGIIQRGQFKSLVALPALARTWSMAGVGDFDGDGWSDLVWQNTQDGRRSIWLMNGTAWSGRSVPLNTVSLDWRIAAVADLDGDAKPDLIWENFDLCARVFWLMNGTQWEFAYDYLPQLDAYWQIVVAADFNNDAYPDLVFQNLGTGERKIWLMDRELFSGETVSLPRVDREWLIAAAVDVNGDGFPDLIWQNLQTGDRSVWMMHGAAWTGEYIALPRVATDWAIVGVMPLTQAFAPLFNPGGEQQLYRSKLINPVTCRI